MVIVKAKIKLNRIRKTPFRSGYRPLFNFISESKTSGQIVFHDRIAFCPGDEGEVEIRFVNKQFLGRDFSIGKEFTFDEGDDVIGEGIISKIVRFE